MAALVRTSFRIDLTDSEKQMASDLAGKDSKFYAAGWFMELGWYEPERQKEWLKDDPAMVQVFDPYTLKDFNEGKCSWDDVEYAIGAQPYLDTVAPFLEKMGVDQFWSTPINHRAAEIYTPRTMCKKSVSNKKLALAVISIARNKSAFSVVAEALAKHAFRYCLANTS